MRAAGLLCLAATALGAGAAWSQTADPVQVPPPETLKTATLNVGDVLPGWVPRRSDVRLGVPRRYTGLYFRTFEGSHFRPDVRAGIPFSRNVGSYFVLAMDTATAGRGQIPRYRRDQSFETNSVEFVGRVALGKDGKPVLSGNSPVIWADQFIRVRRVADASIKTVEKDGSIVSGWFCPSNRTKLGKCY